PVTAAEHLGCGEGGERRVRDVRQGGEGKDHHYAQQPPPCTHTCPSARAGDGTSAEAGYQVVAARLAGHQLLCYLLAQIHAVLLAQLPGNPGQHRQDPVRVDGQAVHVPHAVGEDEGPAVLDRGDLGHVGR